MKGDSLKGLLKAKDKESKEEPEEDTDTFAEAIEELAKALKSNDTKAAKKAFQACVDCCGE